MARLRNTMSTITQSRARIERQRLQIKSLVTEKMSTAKNKTQAVQQVSEIMGLSTRQVFRVLKNNERNGKDE